MAVYNGERYLHEAMDSILGQTFSDFEFIVIDDGSNDGTSSILHEYTRLDERLRVYPQERRGLVYSLNRGCELASGDWIARMDADDIAFPDRLQRQTEFLEKRSDISLLGGAYVLINDQGEPRATMYKPLHRRHIVAAMSEAANPFLHPSVIMRRTAFETVGGYRAAFLHAEDFDLWVRLAERYEVANLAEPLLYYRVHHRQVSHSNLEQGIVSVLGSHAAARVHRKTGLDSVSGNAPVTKAVLRELGVPDRRLRQVLVDACFLQGNLMLLAGYADEALALFDTALEQSRRSGFRTKVGGVLVRAYVRTATREGRVLARMQQETLLLLSAWCTRTGLACSLLVGKTARLLTRARGTVLRSTD